MKELYSFGNNTIRLSVEIFIHSKRDEQCEMNFLIVLEVVKQIQCDKYLQAFLTRLTYQQKIRIPDLTPLSRSVRRASSSDTVTDRFRKLLQCLALNLRVHLPTLWSGGTLTLITFTLDLGTPASLSLPFISSPSPSP